MTVAPGSIGSRMSGQPTPFDRRAATSKASQFAGLRGLQNVLVTDFSLDLTGWVLLQANDISGNGRVIVGSGFNPSGKLEAWMVILRECTVDADCDHGLFCTGVERCVDNACTTSGDPCPPDQTCDEGSGACEPIGVPTVSGWGLLIMSMLLLGGLRVFFGCRNAALGRGPGTNTTITGDVA